MMKILSVLLMIAACTSFSDRVFVFARLSGNPYIDSMNLYIKDTSFSCIALVCDNTCSVDGTITPASFVILSNGKIKPYSDLEQNRVGVIRDRLPVLCLNTTDDQQHKLTISQPSSKEKHIDYTYILKKNKGNEQKCVISDHVVRYRAFEEKEYFDAGRLTVFCANGTLLNDYKNSDPSLKNCKGLMTTTRQLNCSKITIITREDIQDCLVKGIGNSDGTATLIVEVMDTEDVMIHHGNGAFKLHCNKKCMKTFYAEADIMVGCANGKQRYLHMPIDARSQCIYTKYFDSGRVGTYLCKASSFQLLGLAWILWAFFGKALTTATMFLIELGTVGLYQLCKKFANKYLDKRPICADCGTKIQENEELNHGNCVNCICPYCDTEYIRTNFKEHTKNCAFRTVKLNKAYERSKRKSVLIKSVKKITDIAVINGIWFTVLVILVLFAISPVNSQKLKPGFFEEAKLQLTRCGPSCKILGERCYCPSQGRVKRDTGSTKDEVMDVVVNTDWSVIRLDKAYKPAIRSMDMVLSWESSTETEDSVNIAGSSIAVMPLAEKTAIKWTAQHPHADEKRDIIVSIVDFTQIYRTELEYITTDRTVNTWSTSKCFGTCPERCGAKKNGYSKDYPNSGCNGFFCKGIEFGCTCCGADVDAASHEWVIAKWKTEFDRTEIILCVEVSGLERQCKAVSNAEEMDLQGFTFRVGSPTGQIDYLPESVGTVYRTPKGKHIDGVYPDSILLRPEMCKKQVCQHGKVGDVQMQTLTDANTENFWVSWTGLTDNYICHTFDDPTCKFYGADVNTAYRFSKLNETGEHLSQRFFAHKSRVRNLYSSPQLEIAVRPKSNKGQVEVFISSVGLALRRKPVSKAKLNEMRIDTCSGFFGSLAGFSCTVSITASVEEPLNIRLKPDDGLVAVSEKEFTIKEGSQTITVHGFTTLNLDKIKLCVDETDICASKDIKLEEPKVLIKERFENLIGLHTNGSCLDSEGVKELTKCTGLNAKNYLENLVNALLSLIEYWKYVMLVLLVLCVVWLVVIFCKRPVEVNVHSGNRHYKRLSNKEI